MGIALITPFSLSVAGASTQKVQIGLKPLHRVRVYKNTQGRRDAHVGL
jgi:hypothetical protein